MNKDQARFDELKRQAGKEFFAFGRVSVETMGAYRKFKQAVMVAMDKDFHESHAAPPVQNKDQQFVHGGL